MHRCYTWFAAACRSRGRCIKKVIELGPRDNRGVILSVSIKCLWEPSVGGDYMFGKGANPAHRGAEGLVITSRVALKESTNKSITLDPDLHLIKTEALQLIKKKQWKSIEIILHICFCVLSFNNCSMSQSENSHNFLLSAKIIIYIKYGKC